MGSSKSGRRGARKMTPEQRAAAIQRLAGGESPLMLAIEYNVTTTYIHELARKAGWQVVKKYERKPIL